jgi:hypothetical protein
MNSDQARQRAEHIFKQALAARDSRTALAGYEAQARATREKIVRLKALRLAKEPQAQIAEPTKRSTTDGNNNKPRHARRDN